MVPRLRRSLEGLEDFDALERERDRTDRLRALEERVLERDELLAVRDAMFVHLPS